MKFALLSLISAFLILQSAGQLAPGFLVQTTQSASKGGEQQSKPTAKADVGPEYEAYAKEVKKQWANNNYEWLEGEAKRLRATKERLPGGYWKLRVLYLRIETVSDEEASDEAWTENISRLQAWIEQHPNAVMPRIILADVWRTYAWKARGTGRANTVKPENWRLFNERLERTNEILSGASTLEEKCPEWYLTTLLAARGRGEDRDVFEHLFEQSVALEPNYYYLYQAKAGYLLPQWYGEPGDWERFAEAAANKVDGEQGDIIFFTIYSNIMANSDLEFMKEPEHQKSALRLLAGFRAIEKLYGSSPQRLNEACLISFFGNNNQTPAEFMKRIGNDYDLTVWRHDSTFNRYRQEALMRSGEIPRYP